MTTIGTPSQRIRMPPHSGLSLSWAILLLFCLLRGGCAVCRGQETYFVTGGYWTDGISSVDWFDSDENDWEGGLDTSASDDVTLPDPSLTINSTLEITNWAAINGNVVLDGQLSSNTSLNLGSWWNGSETWDGFALIFQDSGDHTFSNITQIVSNPDAHWLWQENGTVDPMTLDERGRVLLIQPDSSNVMTLDPVNATISFPASDAYQSVIGALNLLGYSGSETAVELLSDSINQVDLDATNPSALSLVLGNLSMTASEYGGGLTFSDSWTGFSVVVDPADQKVGFGNGVYLGGNSTHPAIIPGEGLTISGGYASGYDAVAFGYDDTTVAVGNEALAIGQSCTAYGIGAIALAGGNSSANGALSLSIEYAYGPANSTAANAVTIGQNITAQSWGSTVIGNNNTPLGSNTTSWQATDPAFIVGNNTGGTLNNLVVYNNGTVATIGDTTILSRSYVSATSTTQPLALQVNGGSTLTGNVTIGGNVTTQQAQGDVQMGIYGN
jgi:hypothetical protein